jgi:SAM-dependent methyltransferase
MNMPAASAAFACPVCEAKTTELYLDGEEQDLGVSVIGSSREYSFPGRILRCLACGFGFRQLRSSPEELQRLYRKMDPKVYESEVQGRNRTARKHLEIVEQHVRPGRILDVGCASGLFLRHALESGWDVTGVEPSEKLYAEACRNLGGRGEVQCTTLEDARLERDFDAITLWDVLEHVPDPKGFLCVCRALLRHGGYLFLNVPDLDSVEARVLGHHWPLLLPEHLNYFNGKSLRLCGARAGLIPVRFGRRWAFFSVKYVACRAAQHHIPGSTVLRKAAESFLGRLLIPVSLGESLAVWRSA